MLYTIEVSDSDQELIDKVNNKLEERWEIVKEGFKVVSIEHENDEGVYIENMFYQVMIKLEASKTKSDFTWD